MTTRKWPDMSAYGVYFGISNGSIVMLDKTGTYAGLAKIMKMRRTRWIGLWSLPGLVFNIPDFDRLFPKAKIVELTLDEIHEIMKTQFVGRQDLRFSQQKGSTHSWHPRRINAAKRVSNLINVDTEASASAETAPAAAPNVENALKETIFYGHNFKGQKVYESGDGARYSTDAASNVIEREKDGEKSPYFLRVDAAAPESLKLCAMGLVTEMQRQRLESVDLERYLTAMYGQINEAYDREERIAQFHEAIDQAMVSSIQGADESHRFTTAVALHQNRPSYWRPEGDFPTPAPISYLMQEIVDGISDNGVIADSSANGEHTWNMPGAARWDGQPHDIFIGGSFNNETEAVRFDGIKVARSDHKMILESLAARSDEGTSVFLHIADKNGELSADDKRMLASVGLNYEVVGLVDIDGALVSPGNDLNSRLLVVGQRRTEQNLAFSVPSKVPVICDFDTLNIWANAANMSCRGEANVEFPVDNVVNAEFSAVGMQSPYVPASQVSEPRFMVPQNLLSPVRLALNRLVKKYGKSIDEIVADSLGVDIDSLGDRFSSEQVDAIALGIDAINTGDALIEADKTGIGKGRVMAGLIWYTQKIGRIPVFMTEQKELLNAIFRDIQDIGAYDDLKNAILINNGLRIVLPDGSPVPTRSGEPLVDGETEMLDGCPLIVGTYAQFNRKSDVAFTEEELRSAVRILENTGSVILAVGEMLRSEHPLTKQFLVEDKNLVKMLTKASSPQEEQEIVDAIRQKRMDDEDDGFAAVLMQPIDDAIAGVEALSARYIQRRIQWIQGLDKRFVLLSDESHNISGVKSNIGKNIRPLVINGAAVIYSSATFASVQDKFGIYQRAFPPIINVETIPATLRAGGEPLQEIFTSMLATDGRLIRREQDDSMVPTIPFEDKANFEKYEDICNQVADIQALLALASREVDMRILRDNTRFDSDYELALAAAVSINQAQGEASDTRPDVARSHIGTNGLGSRIGRLNQQFVASLSAKWVSELAIKAIRSGMKPIIYCESTNEFALNALADSGQLQQDADAKDVLISSRPLTIRDILHRYINDITIANKLTKIGRKIVKKEPLEVTDPRILQLQESARALVDRLPDLPLSPIDFIQDEIKAAGHSVGEYSGRKRCLQVKSDGTFTVNKRKIPLRKKLNDDFNNGELDAMIITKSGATGLDFHAAEKFLDHSQRVFIPASMPEDLTRFNQAKGRVNRFDQVCYPETWIPRLGLPAERRMESNFNRSQRRHSATVAANADGADISFQVPDLYNRVGLQAVVSFLKEEEPIRQRLMISDLELEDPEVNLTQRVLARSTMLRVEDANFMFDEIDARYRGILIKAEAEGHNPLSSHKRDYRAKIVDRKVFLAGDPGSESVFSSPVMAEEIEFTGRPPLRVFETKWVVNDIENTMKAKRNFNVEGVFSIIEENAEASMLQNLPSQFNSVAEALAAKTENHIQRAFEAIKDAKSLIPLLQIGNIIEVNEDGATRPWIIRDIYIPSDIASEKIRLSSLKVTMTCYKHSTQFGRAYTLAELVPIAGRIQLAPEQGPEAIAAVLKSVFELPKAERRIVLTGNLYRAAEYAAANRIGTPISFTDANGVWRQAIGIRADMDLTDVMEMPFRFESLDEVNAFMTEHPSLPLFFGHSEAQQFIVLNPSKRPGVAFELDQRTCLDAQRARSTVRKAGGNLIKMADAKNAMSILCEEAGMPMVGGKYREWSETYKLAAAKARAQAEAPSIADDDLLDLAGSRPSVKISL